MPKAFLRLFAVLLLALTIPVQGMAAVTAGQCMAFGHHQDGGGHDDQGQSPDGADGHDHAAHSQSDGGAKQGDEGGSNSHCGPCTACCASATIAGSVTLTLDSPASHAPYAFSQSVPPSVQLDGLDRPPLAL